MGIVVKERNEKLTIDSKTWLSTRETDQIVNCVLGTSKLNTYRNLTGELNNRRRKGNTELGKCIRITKYATRKLSKDIGNFKLAGQKMKKKVT